MTKSQLFLTCALAVISMNTASAAEKLYYRSDAYSCEGKQKIMNARFKQSDELVSISLLTINQKSDRRNVTEIKVDKAKVVETSTIINNQYGKPWLEIKNFKLDGTEKLTVHHLESDKSYNSECDKIVLSPRKSPKEALQSEIDTLNKRPIESHQLLHAYNQYLSSPPIDWLPALDQTAMKESRNKAWDEMFEAYFPAMIELFEKAKDNQKDALRIVSDMHETRKVAIDRSLKKNLRDKIDDLKIYWALTHRNDKEKSMFFAVKSKDELCDNMYINNDWNVTLRWSSGLPTPMWSRDYANELLEWSEQCDSDEATRFAEKIKSEWPKIEKTSLAFPKFVENLNERLATAKTVDAMKEKQWLTFTSESEKELGIKKYFLDITTELLINPHLDSVLPTIKEDLSKKIANLDNLEVYTGFCKKSLGFDYARDHFKKALLKSCNELIEKGYSEKIESIAKQSTIDAEEKVQKGELTLSQLSSYCDDTFSSVKSYKARRELSAKCLPEIADKIVIIGKNVLNKAENKLKSLPMNIESMKQLSSIEKELELFPDYGNHKELTNSREKLTKLFSPILQKINTKRETIETGLSKTMAEKYQKVLDTEDILNKVQDAEKELKELCASYYDYNLLSASQKCTVLATALNTKSKEIKCQETWDKTKFPDDFAEKLLPLPNGRTVELRELLCNLADINDEKSSLIGIKDSGIFSSDYLLQGTFSEKGEEKLVLSIELHEAEEKGFLKYENLKTSKGKIDISHLEKPEEEILMCFKTPKKCLAK